MARKTKLPLLVALMILAVACQSKDDTITLFLAGDSTVADKPYKEGNPEKGWGQVFPLYFKVGRDGGEPCR
jgi:hypothetical protein